MKTLFALAAVLLLASIIDAAPKPAQKQKQANQPTPAHKKTARPAAAKHATATPKVQKRADKNKRQIPYFLPGNAVYPNYYPQPVAPMVDFQSALHAAFLSGVHYAEVEKHLKEQNLTDSSGKPLPLDAKTFSTFEASFGDKNASDAKSAAEKFISFDGSSNVNVVNPFFIANDGNGKLQKADSGLPSVKAGTAGEANSSVVALVNPYHTSQVDAVFGPEIAPRYEIHYTPGQGLTLDPLTHFSGASFNHAAIGLSPAAPAAYAPAAYAPAAFEPAVYGPEIGSYNGFGIAPGYNGLVNPYPYPYPFLPAFDPKGFKPNGKGNGGKTPDSNGQQPDSTSPTYPEGTSETPVGGAPSESPSAAPSESSVSEAPQK